MDKDNFFSDDITSMKSSSAKKIDDFASLKDNTMDFLSHERSEKFDVEKPKAAVDDFLNFTDDFGDSEPKKQEQASPVLLPSFDKFDDKFEDPKKVQPEPEIDFNAIDDDYVNPYASSTLKAELQNEKFISSEDLLTDFKDPAPADAEDDPEPVVEAPKPAVYEAPKPEPLKRVEISPSVVVAEKPPVSEPIKPVEKPKSAPPPAPVKQPPSNDTQIEAEKIFKSIGLG